MGECVCVTSLKKRAHVYMTDLALLIPVIQAERIHGANDGGQRLDGVAIDDGLVLLNIIAWETILVNDPGKYTIHTVKQIQTHTRTQSCDSFYNARN